MVAAIHAKARSTRVSIAPTVQARASYARLDTPITRAAGWRPSATSRSVGPPESPRHFCGVGGASPIWSSAAPTCCTCDIASRRTPAALPPATSTP